MKTIYNVVTFLAAVVVLAWASFEVYLHAGYYMHPAAACSCACGCSKTGKCDCGDKCSCDTCDCGKTGTCDCDKAKK
jgi:hypothetical protein